MQPASNIPNNKLVGCCKPNVTENPKKKQVTCQKREFSQDKKLKSNVTGPPCNCKTLKYFQVIIEEDRVRMISHFNLLKTKDEQDAYISHFYSSSSASPE